MGGITRYHAHDDEPQAWDAEAADLPGLLLEAAPPVMVAVRGAVRSFATPERTVLQFRVAQELLAGPGTITELAAATGASAAAVSKVVAAMTELGLIERRPDAEDRRITHLSLTPKGRARALTMLAAVRHELAGRLADLDPARRGVLAQGLRILAALFDPKQPSARNEAGS
jgi:DNA-binding MarR family transcriptional regulator